MYIYDIYIKRFLYNVFLRIIKLLFKTQEFISTSVILLYNKLKDVQRKQNSNNKIRVKFKGTMTKWPVQKQTLKTARNMHTTGRNRHKEPIKYARRWRIRNPVRARSSPRSMLKTFVPPSNGHAVLVHSKAMRPISPSSLFDTGHSWTAGNWCVNWFSKQVVPSYLKLLRAILSIWRFFRK